VKDEKEQQASIHAFRISFPPTKTGLFHRVVEIPCVCTKLTTAPFPLFHPRTH
jgi:hypothetical protein